MDSSTKPFILIVDDELDALQALNIAMVRRYKEDYEIESRTSPAAALELLTRARENKLPVALVIADQWMPEMTGMELLLRVHEMHPAAQRALLVAWGDRTAAPTIQHGCAFHHRCCE